MRMVSFVLLLHGNQMVNRVVMKVEGISFRNSERINISGIPEREFPGIFFLPGHLPVKRRGKY